LQGNIIDQKVEAIVNAANVRLDHGSGVAKCIKDAAGKKFNEECQKLVKKRGGRLNSLEAVHTSAGNIPPPVKYVIHVAGPEAVNFADKRLLEDAMKRTFENVLMYANDVLKVSSVAIPAISSGTVFNN
jgi:O-acetyl-ADP-ribose deacetylase (regulator of RNase III)